MKKILALMIFCCFTTITIADVPNNSAGDTAILQFKEYLRAMKSVAIDFTQEDSKEKKVEGKLLINKPYRFRCNYYSPFPLLIIGNKNYVTIYDYDMEQVSRIKAAENIFNFLLEDKEDFDKHFTFVSAINNKDVFKISLYHSLTERSSEIIFNKSTQQIQRIKISENNHIITVIFDKIVKVAKFEDDLFKFKNPEIFGPPARLTKSELEKKYVVSLK